MFLVVLGGMSGSVESLPLLLTGLLGSVFTVGGVLDGELQSTEG